MHSGFRLLLYLIWFDVDREKNPRLLALLRPGSAPAESPDFIDIRKLFKCDDNGERVESDESETSTAAPPIRPVKRVDMGAIARKAADEENKRIQQEKRDALANAAKPGKGRPSMLFSPRGPRSRGP